MPWCFPPTARSASRTPVALKNFLGGGAYTLSGLVQAVGFVPFHGRATLPEKTEDNEIIVGAVCNGRQAGGGQVLAPNALIDDGLLDVVALHSFPADSVDVVVKEMMDPTVDGQYVKRRRVPWVEWSSEGTMPINLDGEPIQENKVRFDAVEKAIRLIVPDDCSLLSQNG